GDPIGRLWIELHGRPAHVDVAARDVLELHRDVGELEGGKRFEILLRLLVGFEPKRVLDDLLLVLAGQFRFDRRQPVELSPALARSRFSNSRWWIAASTCEASTPRSATRSSVSRTTCCTFSASSAATPFKPAPKTASL